MAKQQRSRTTDTGAADPQGPDRSKRAATRKAATANAPKKAPPAAPPTTAEMESAARQAAERAFIEASTARGEAQALGPSGELAEGATHELVPGTGPDDPPKVRRKRFSAA